MATEKNTKKSGTKSAGKSGGKSGGSKKAAPKTAASRKAEAKNAPERRPIRREVGALICFALCMVSVLSCFGVSSILTDAWAKLVRGLFGGAGFYILPFSLFMMFVILLFHGGKPVRARSVCAFAVVLCIGSLVHLMTGSDLSWGKGILGELWIGGQSGSGCGIVCGLLAMGVEAVISKIGAVIVFAALLLFCILTTLNMTVPSIIRAIQERPRLKYDEPEEEGPDAAQALVNHVAQKHIDHVQQRRARERKRIEEYDLPVDEPSAPPKKKHRSAVPSPDEFILEQRAASAPEPAEELPEAPEQLVFSPEATVHVPEQAQHEQPSEPVLPEPLRDAPTLEERFSAGAKPPKPVDPAVAEEFVQHMPQKVKAEEAKASAIEIAQEISAQEEAPKPAYVFPPKQLLRMPKNANVDGTAEMRENAHRLDEALKSFGIDAHIVNVTRGPSVTRYELELDRGVKLSKITGLANDIALSLGASGVRISTIPDKISVVGIEVPNKLVSTVYAREVIDSDAFARAKSGLSFAVGKDIGGNCIIGDIAKLPHLLIAGTTGSGKSVCMNSLIISLLYKSPPDEVKFIMVDPKMVELGIYNGIPHLLIPVVTDPKKAAGALQWAVTEMMRRYRMMADAGVRNLDEYNRLAANSEEYDAMPRIVVVIDELADLMLVAAKEVEEAICRVAQMGRASGIHLIVATQRPSADVITGLMKANIPSRIAFAVSSSIESRIILDTTGAEKLVGKGDMLFAPLGQGKPKRVQGCFITDDEVQEVVTFIKEQHLESFADAHQQEILQQIDQKAASGGKGAEPSGGTPVRSEEDELLPAAVEVILETGQASVSMLQRRLKLGYARAARIVDEMEDKGIVGPFEGSKPRQLLITKEQWQAMQNGETLPAPEPVEEELP